MVFAEFLRGDEDVVVAGGVEPVANGGPEVAGHERGDEAELTEPTRRTVDRDELEVRLNVVVGFGIARDDVLFPFRRRIGGRLEVEKLPTRLQIRKPLGIEDQSGRRVERRGRVNDCAVDEFAVVLIHSCWLMVVGGRVEERRWLAPYADLAFSDPATTARLGIVVWFCRAYAGIEKRQGCITQQRFGRVRARQIALRGS